MNQTDVTKEGIQHGRPGRDAVTGVSAGRNGAGRRMPAETPMVPAAEFQSYYGQPIINQPVWASPDIPGYLYLGGLAGASSVLALGAQITRRPGVERSAKMAAAAGGCLSIAALIHDLGRPARFLNMFRVLKPTSPMSVGSWLLAGYVPLAAAAAGSEVTGVLPTLGTAASLGAAALGPAVASYTGALISDTAVPAWHEGHSQMPWVFASSGAAAAGGLGLLASPLAENGPARRMGIGGAAVEMTMLRLMEQRLGLVGEPYRQGKAGAYLRGAELISAAAVAAAALAARRSRVAAAGAGLGLMVSSALTRFGIFNAGLASASDPKYTVVPQRERLRARKGESVQDR